MLKKALALLLAASTVSPSFSQECGTPIFSDSFDSSATFAENWVPKDRRIKSENGKIVFPNGGTLQMRGDTPLEFCAEMEATMDMSHQPDKSRWISTFCGFRIENFSFFALPSGNTWMIWKLPGWDKAHGKQIKIDGFELGKPFKLTLLRKVENGVATYVFKANGKDAGSFSCAAPASSPCKPLEIFSANVNMTLDNFSLRSIKRSAEDSPNVVFNSSFEQERDGFPLYYCRSGFDLAKATTIPYEDFLATWTLDKNEKHSGEQALKMVFDESMAGQNLWAWGAGTVKDQPGVFSVWMKADKEDFPVTISYGKRQEVKVGTTWRRYEVVNPKLPGAGVYSPVTISFNKVHGTLWVDDLQAEFLDGAKLQQAGELATPYKPSELDKQRLGKQAPPVRAPDITINKLPGGLVPDGDLDAWKDKATKVDEFYFKDKAPRNKTEAYLACDDKNLYIGYRCFVDDLGAVDTKPAPHDSFAVFGKDSVEFFLDPAANGSFHQFAADAGGTRLEIGKGRDVAWNGAWSSTAKLNEKTKSVDHEITIPFSTLSDALMNPRWLVNLCRNDSSAKEHLAIAKTPILGFQRTEYWPYAQLPADVVAKYSLGVTAAGYSDDGGGVAVSLALNNLTGKDLRLNAELLDAGGDGDVLAAKEITLKPGGNDISFLSKTKTNKARLKLTDNGAPLLDQTVALEKRNPVSMLGRLNYYMNEQEAVFKVNTNLADVDKMTAALSVAGKTVEMPAAPEFKVAMPLQGVPDGTHTAVLTLAKDGKKVAETSSPLVKRPHKEGAAQINHFTRSLVHDGKPVFQFAPFFVFSKHNSKEYAVGAVDFAARYGFKYLHILVDNRAAEQALLAIGHAQAKGMKVMLWTKQYELTDEEGDRFREKFDFPNVISQMVLDEPELGMPSDSARAYLRKMRTKYPYQPVHMNNTVLGIPNRYAGLETDILMLDDYLTNNENRTVASVVNASDIMREAGEEEGKPCFYFIVGGNFPLHHREPSYAEQVAQTYGNIAAGCTGLSYFYGVPMTPGNWKAYIQLNQEVLALNDALLSEEEVSQATCSADPKLLRSITKKHDGFVYVVSCNLDAKPMDKVGFALPVELKYAGNAEVMFEDREIPVEGGKFTDDFAGHSRHVYKVKLK